MFHGEELSAQNEKLLSLTFDEAPTALSSTNPDRFRAKFFTAYLQGLMFMLIAIIASGAPSEIRTCWRPERVLLGLCTRCLFGHA